MKVCFVHENHRLARRVRDEGTQSILRRDAGGRIVRIADVNETSFGRGDHFWQVVAKRRGERHLHDFSAVDLGVIEDCLKGWIGDDKISSPPCSVNVSAQTFRISPEPSPSRI